MEKCGAGKDKGAKGVVAAKEKRARANDDEVDKCARGGGGTNEETGKETAPQEESASIYIG